MRLLLILSTVFLLAGCEAITYDWEGACNATGGDWHGAPGANCEGNLLALIIGKV